MGFFFPCDTLKDYKELEEMLRIYLDFIRPKTDKRIFIFLDEISFVDSWQRAIKYLADSGKLKNSLFLLTGSNDLDLKYSSERLPGRRGEIFPWDLTFLPLNFAEFQRLLMKFFWLGLRETYIRLANQTYLPTKFSIEFSLIQQLQ